MISEYDRLFGDQALAELVADVALPDGSPLAIARARAWEGQHEASEAAAEGASEPWSTFVVALAKHASGKEARARLLALATDASLDPRVRLWAFTALRAEGWVPDADAAHELLGVVLEVPVKGSYDVLAAYADGSVRFLGHVGQSSVVEGSGEPGGTVREVLRLGASLASVPVVSRERPAKRGPADHLRLSALTPAGVRRVDVPWREVEAGGAHAPFFEAATKLFAEVT